MSRLTTLPLPGVGTIAELKQAHSLGVRSLRVATHCTEADVAAQHRRPPAGKDHPYPLTARGPDERRATG